MKCPSCHAQIADGGDPHECPSPAPSEGDPLSKRAAEKLVRMATVYGQGVTPGRIRERLGIDPAEAKLHLRVFFRKYPEMRKNFPRRMTEDEILGTVLEIDENRIVFDTSECVPQEGIGNKFFKATEEFVEAPAPEVRREPVEVLKQWIVMRTDLKMRKGKMISQGAHASMKVILDLGQMVEAGTPMHLGGEGVPFPMFMARFPDPVKSWIEGLFTKVCVRTESEEDLDAIYEKAKEAGLPCALIVDSGKTEFKGVPTKTCCAIGPCLPSQAKDIVGHLKLL